MGYEPPIYLVIALNGSIWGCGVMGTQILCKDKIKGSTPFASTAVSRNAMRE